MISQKYVDVKVSGQNYHHWKNLGYPIDTAKRGRGNITPHETITVSVYELPSGSRTYVNCKCDECGKKYRQKFLNNTDRCRTCRQRERNKGNTYGKVHKGRKNPNWEGVNNPIHSMNWTGENHPNWNPNKPELQAYGYRIRVLTEQNYRQHKSAINPHEYPRTLCGVEGGYQLDHIISIKDGFERGLSPEEMAHPKNLQMLPWEQNREKW